MPYKSFYLTPQGELRSGLAEADIRFALESRQGVLWVDIGDTTEEDGRFLARVFDFHPLAIEDCVDPAIHSAKLDEFDDYLFLVLRGIDYTVEAHIVATTELNVFLGPNYVVTNHNTFLYSVDGIRKLVEMDGRPMRRGAEFLAYLIMDALVENIIPTIDRLGERMDEIEDEILRNPQPVALEAATALKRSSLRLRRAMAPQREVLSQLGRRDLSHISREAQRYFRDVYDSVVRIEGFNENLRERTDTAMTIYMSVVANRQNETMKLLSILAAIFLPLTLIAGIYGMNFEHMPELQWRWGYFAVLGFMGTVVAVTIWIFWVRRWFSVEAKKLERFVPTAVEPHRLAGYLGHAVRWHR